jgi:hypothetical protein
MDVIPRNALVTAIVNNVATHSKRELVKIRILLDLFFGCYFVSNKNNRIQLKRGRFLINADRKQAEREWSLPLFLLKLANRSGSSGLASCYEEWSFQALQQLAGQPCKARSQFPLMSKFFPGRNFSKVALLTLVGLGRSIPKGIKQVKNKIKNDYLARMTSRDAPVRPFMLKEVYHFTKRLVKKALRTQDDFDLKEPEFVASTVSTACLENGVADGGSYEYFRKLVTTRHAGIGEHPSAWEVRWAKIVKEDYADCLMQWTNEDGKIIPFGKVLHLPEAGNKIRTATVHNAAFVSILRTINQVLLRIAKSKPQIREPLKGRPVEALLKVLYSPHHKVFSADLSKASDYIPFELAHSVVDAICDTLGYSDLWRRNLKIATGPFLLKDGDLSFQTTRGLLMGLGVTWPILSIINSFCAEFRSRTINDYLIMGDDLLGIWSRKRIKTYKKNLRELRLKINLRKSIISDDFGVFTEQYISIKKPKENPLPQSWSELDSNESIERSSLWNVVRHRRLYLSIATLAKATDINGRPFEKDRSIRATICDAMNLAYRQCRQTWQRRRVIDLFYRMHGKVLQNLKHAGLRVHWPKALLGGGALPIRNPGTLFLEAASSIARYHNSHERFSEHLSDVNAIWQKSMFDKQTNNLLMNMRRTVASLPEAKHGSAPLRAEVGQAMTALVIVKSRYNIYSSTAKPWRFSTKQVAHELLDYARILAGITQSQGRQPVQLDYAWRFITPTDKSRVKGNPAEDLKTAWRPTGLSLMGSTSNTDHAPTRIRRPNEKNARYRVLEKTSRNAETAYEFSTDLTRVRGLLKNEDSKRLPLDPLTDLNRSNESGQNMDHLTPIAGAQPPRHIQLPLLQGENRDSTSGARRLKKDLPDPVGVVALPNSARRADRLEAINKRWMLAYADEDVTNEVVHHVDLPPRMVLFTDEKVKVPLPERAPDIVLEEFTYQTGWTTRTGTRYTERKAEHDPLRAFGRRVDTEQTVIDFHDQKYLEEIAQYPEIDYPVLESATGQQHEAVPAVDSVTDQDLPIELDSKHTPTAITTTDDAVTLLGLAEQPAPPAVVKKKKKTVRLRFSDESMDDS